MSIWHYLAVVCFLLSLWLGIDAWLYYRQRRRWRMLTKPQTKLTRKPEVKP